MFLALPVLTASARPSGEARTSYFPTTAYLVTGHVTDVETGWPIYARLDIENGHGEPVWTDPGTGEYSVWLEEGIPYTFHIEALYPGYLPQSRQVGPLSGNLVADFELQADKDACIAPGYSFEIAYWEDFEESDGGYTHNGIQDEWEWGTPVTWPFSCASGSLCWGTDLDGNYNNYATYVLLSPVIDLSSVQYGTPLHARWKQAWHIESSWADIIYADVSINGGDYQLLWQHTGPTVQVGWSDMDFNLQSAAGGTARFRFGVATDNSTTYSGYYIDQVRIVTDCASPDGGLVVGNVFESWNQTGLNGAQLSSEEGGSATTYGTPDNPNLADGFYWLYAAPSTHIITATYPGYAHLTIPVEVISGAAVWQDYSLRVSGDLMADPASLQAFVPPSRTYTASLELINLGEADIGYDIYDVSLEADGQAPVEDVNWLSVSPVSGTIPAGASGWVSVTMDAGAPGIISPGEHYAELHIENSTAGGETVVPVTMTVPSVGVSLSPTSASTSGGPGTSAVYTLTITNTGSISDSYNLVVEGNHWVTTLPTTAGPLAPGFSEPLTVTVDIPDQVAGGESDRSQVTVSSQSYNDVSASAILTTTALAVYNLDIDPLLSSATGAPESWITYPITITNTGNVTDSYSIQVNSDWAIDAPTATHHIASGEWITIAFHVNVPGEAHAGESDIAQLQFTSQGDGVTSRQSTLISSASARYGVGISPALVLLKGMPGEVLTATLQVTNTGNITETFAIKVVSGTWTVSPQSSLGPLTSGVSDTLAFTVTIPVSATANDSEEAWIELTSDQDDSVQASSAVSTTVSVYALRLEPEYDSAGIAALGTITYTLTLTNSGSETDTYQLSVGDTTPGWEIQLLQQMCSLPPGSNERVLVVVTAPPGAHYGAVGTGTIYVFGTHGAHASSILMTRVDHGLIYLPAVLDGG
jgi:uncharacterized membrane protein